MPYRTWPVPRARSNSTMNDRFDFGCELSLVSHSAIENKKKAFWADRAEWLLGTDKDGNEVFRDNVYVSGQ